VQLRDEDGELLLDEEGVPRRCGGTLRVTATGQTEARRNHKRRYQYRCTSSALLMILQSATDEYVLEVVAEILRDPRNLALLSPRSPDMSPDRERRDVLVERLAGLERDWADGKATGDQLQRATMRHNTEIAEIDASLASVAQRSAASPIAGAPDPGAAFLAAPLDIQRAVLATVAYVEIKRATQRGTRWTKDRVLVSPAAAE
jgi:hypothetical protein